MLLGLLFVVLLMCHDQGRRMVSAEDDGDMLTNEAQQDLPFSDQLPLPYVVLAGHRCEYSFWHDECDDWKRARFHIIVDSWKMCPPKAHCLLFDELGRSSSLPVQLISSPSDVNRFITLPNLSLMLMFAKNFAIDFHRVVIQPVATRHKYTINRVELHLADEDQDKGAPDPLRFQFPFRSKSLKV